MDFSLLDHLSSFTIDSVPRRENWHVDAMASVASLVPSDKDIEEYHFVVHIRHSPAISDKPESNALMCAHVDLKEWYSNIYNYLKTRNFLNDAMKNDHTRIRKI